MHERVDPAACVCAASPGARVAARLRRGCGRAAARTAPEPSAAARRAARRRRASSRRPSRAAAARAARRGATGAAAPSSRRAPPRRRGAASRTARSRSRRPTPPPRAADGRRTASRPPRCRRRRRTAKAELERGDSRDADAREPATSTGSTTGRSTPTRGRSTTRRSASSSRPKKRSARRTWCSRRTSPTRRRRWRLSCRPVGTRYTRWHTDSQSGAFDTSAASADFELFARKRVALRLLFSRATSFFSQPAGRKTPCLTSACAPGGRQRRPPTCHFAPTMLHRDRAQACPHLATDLKQRHNMWCLHA